MPRLNDRTLGGTQRAASDCWRLVSTEFPADQLSSIIVARTTVRSRYWPVA